MRKRSRSQRIALRVARAAPWLLALSSPAALTLLACASGALLGLMIASDVYAPPAPRPGYPIDPAHRIRLARPIVEANAAGPPAPATPAPRPGPSSYPGEREAGFRWTLEAGLRDAAHCPAITTGFHQGCVDAVAASLSPDI